ncbi:MAG: iron-containing alcohol dehydrogenase [Phycisphaerae bacterium]
MRCDSNGLFDTRPVREFLRASRWYGYPEVMDHIDPTDLAVINDRVRAWATPDEQIHPIRIDRVTVADDALDALVDEVRTLSSRGQALLVVDHAPMHRAGHDLKTLIEDALARACKLTVRRLPEDPTQTFQAEIEAARKLADDLNEFAALVSLGSGSITDVAKYARHLLAETTGRKLPFISFPTAASVTAYTSALAVLTMDGVKRTLPAVPPDVVICDLRTLGDAPRVMTQAGFGEVLARSVSYGDWYLANQLGADDSFSLVPGKLLEQAEQDMVRRADGVATGDLVAVRLVTEALLLSGLAMSIVNQTAPLSGWEHAISHFLDLTAAAAGRETALHGGQVGVATLIAARAYERAWAELDLDRLTDERDDAAYRKTIERVFQRYDTRGTMLDELWRDFAKKRARWRNAADARRHFVQRKRAGEYDEFLCHAVRPVSEIESALREAGAPRRFADLNEPIPRACPCAAVRFAHLIRARFTLGDLLDESGWLDDARADELLDESA